MGRLWQRAIEAAGLCEVRDRALAGGGLSPADLTRLRASDLLIVAGLADAVRAQHFGDEVRVLNRAPSRRDDARPSGVLVFPPPQLSIAAITGQELLLEVAFTRLATPVDRGLAVSFDAIGLELAQAALTFGADALCGDLGAKRVLPLLDGAAARRVELQGLIERAGRSVRFVEDAGAVAGALPMESRS